MCVDAIAPVNPAARANGTVRPSAIPITMSRTAAVAVKCFSTCSTDGIFGSFEASNFRQSVPLLPAQARIIMGQELKIGRYIMTQSSGQGAAPQMTFTLPPLPYPFDALEPYIDAKTMEIHHDKHHGAYVTNLNKALEGQANLQGLSIEELLSNLDRVPENIRTTVRNNGGGHMNHSMFWKIMKKGGGGEPKGKLGDAIKSAFGSFADFKTKFSQAGVTRFGSGWSWLFVKDGKLTL